MTVSARAPMLVGAFALVLGACGPRDAAVGVGARPDGAAGGASGAGGTDGSGGNGGILFFSSEMTSNDDLWDEDEVPSWPLDLIQFGATSQGDVTPDGRVALLIFPGDPSQTDTTRVGSDANTGIELKQAFRYGTLRARVAWASCSPSEEVVSAASLYLADGNDGNGNGLPDLHELDFQVFCGTPSFIVLSAWSDLAKDSAGRETYRKRSHAVDTSTGEIYETLVESEPGFTKTGVVAELAHPGFPEAGAFYDIGISWQVDRVRFFISLGGREVTLWELTDGTYIPQVALPVIFNLWHPANHWLPSRLPAAFPAHDSVFMVDWVSWSSG